MLQIITSTPRSLTSRSSRASRSRSNAGEIHAIMGPNGAGKSTLGYVLSADDPGYEVTDGDSLVHAASATCKTRA